MKRQRGFKAVITPPAIALIFVDADMAGSSSPRGVIGQDQGDVTGLGHDGIGLVRRALAKAVGMNMDIRDDLALGPAAMLPEFAEPTAVDNDDAGRQRVRVNIVVIDKFFDTSRPGFRAEQKSTAFAPAARATTEFGDAGVPKDSFTENVRRRPEGGARERCY